MEDLDLKELQANWKSRQVEKINEEKKRREDAFAKAYRIAQKLKNEYQIKDVFLYGSLVWGKHYTVLSDIDLLVEGFPETINFWKVLGQMEHLAAPFSLQLVPAENAHQSLLNKVYREGMRL